MITDAPTIALIVAFVVGFLTNFYSTATGGAGLIIVPMMIFMGLTPQEAVGTSVVGYLGVSVVGWWVFHQKKHINYKIGTPATVIFAVGMVVGTLLLPFIPAEALKKAIGIFTILFILLLVIAKDHGVVPKPHDSPTRHKVGYGLFFPLGIHNGIFGGGTSALATYVLILCFGETFLQAAGTRKPVFVIRTFVGIAMFMYLQLVHWPLAIIMIISSAFGSYFGAHYAFKKGNKWVKWVFTIVTVASAVKLLI